MLFCSFFNKKIIKKLEKSLLVIDKKAGRTSHDEVDILRKKISSLFQIKKIKLGHSGTLDPKVTGVLVIGIGKGTRVLEYILLSEKKYISKFIFHKKISKKIFKKEIKKFLGKIRQLPPQKSAVKRVVREREVYELKILDFDKNERRVEILTSVERGTYIRKLAHDIGEKIGVQISMGDLRRVQAGPFSLNNSNFIGSEEFLNKLEKFFKSRNIFLKIFYFYDLLKYIYPLEELFLRMEDRITRVEIKKEALKYIRAGNPVRWKNIKNKIKIKNDQKIYSIWYKDNIIGICEKMENYAFDDEDEVLKIRKIF